MVSIREFLKPHNRVQWDRLTVKEQEAVWRSYIEIRRDKSVRQEEAAKNALIAHLYTRRA